MSKWRNQSDAALVGITLPGVGANVGATGIVVPISLGVAMAGMIAGAVASFLIRRSDGHGQYWAAKQSGNEGK